MIELDLIISKIPYRNIVLATDNITDPFIWYFFIVLLIVGGIIAGAMLLSFSRKPDDWEHNPAIDETYAGVRLDYFANSLKLNPIESNDDSLIKNRIQMLFFEKVRAVHGISAEELNEIKIKNQNKLQDLIKDQEITDWILNAKQKEKKTSINPFSSNREEKKQNTLAELNRILDKLEAWGE